MLADVLARLSQPLAEGSDTRAAVTLGCGGSAANVAAWLAAEGVATALVGVVGDDPLGQMQASDLRQRGVGGHLTVVADRPTGVVVAVVDQLGQRSMLTSRGAAGRLRPEHLPESLFQSGRHLHLSGYVLLDPETRDAGLAALAMARQARMSISVDPSSREPLRRVGSQTFRQWSRGADLLLPNLEEGSCLTGKDDPLAIGEDLLSDYREVGLSLGSAGGLWAHSGGHLHLPAAAGTVVDTTGAGDAFTAGWLSRWLAGRGGEAALAAALRLAARAVAAPGARPNSAGPAATAADPGQEKEVG